MELELLYEAIGHYAIRFIHVSAFLDALCCAVRRRLKQSLCGAHSIGPNSVGALVSLWVSFLLGRRRVQQHLEFDPSFDGRRGGAFHERRFLVHIESQGHLSAKAPSAHAGWGAIHQVVDRVASALHGGALAPLGTETACPHGAERASA